MNALGVLLMRGLIVRMEDSDLYYVSLGFQTWCAIAVRLKVVQFGEKAIGCFRSFTWGGGGVMRKKN